MVEVQQSVKLNYVENSMEDGVLWMSIRGVIGDDFRTDFFINDLEYITNFMPEIHTVNVKINSPGGSVFAGMDLWGAIYKHPRLTINTIVVGVAASIAGVISQAGSNREAYSFSSMMIHDVSIAGLEEDDPRVSENDKKMLRQFRDMIAEVLSARSKMTKEEVIDLMVGKETWLKAGEAKDKGFFDNVIEVAEEEEEIDVSNALKAYKYFENKLNQVPNKQIQMKQLFNKLGLNESASEDKAIDAVNGLQSKVENLTAEANTHKEENETLKADNAVLAEKVKAFEDAEIANFVEEQIEAGKFDENQKETLIANATKDFEAFKAMSNAVKPAHVDVSKVLDNKKGGEAPAGDGSLKTDLNTEGKTFSELDKNNPELLNRIRVENHDEYVNLYEKQFGVRP